MKTMMMKKKKTKKKKWKEGRKKKGKKVEKGGDKDKRLKRAREQNKVEIYNHA